MIVKGPTTQLPDGSEVCIGTGVDANGKITGRFAVPYGHDWDAPDVTESLEFVDSLNDLPPINPDYKPTP